MTRPIATAAAVIVAIASVIGCSETPSPSTPRSPGLVPATKEFTAESRGLKFSFRYPAAWKLDPTPTPWATLAMAVAPPNDELGTRLVFVLVDGDMAAKMIANGPVVPRAAAVVAQSHVNIGGVIFLRTEWRGRLGNDPTFRRSVELQGDVGGRCIILQGYASAPLGSDGDADMRFEKWRPTFEAVLATAHLETP